MIKLPRQPRYRDRGRSLDLLKTPWKSRSVEEMWALLRSITIREHLHTTGYFGRNFASDAVPDSSYLLRRRRREIARRLRLLGYEVSDLLFKHSLPKGVAWRNSMGAIRGVRPHKSSDTPR